MDEVSVGKLADIPDGDYRVFAVDEFEVGIFRTGSKVLAYENSCPHAGGPICQGKIFQQGRGNHHARQEERRTTLRQVAPHRLPIRAWLRVRSRHRLPSGRSVGAAHAHCVSVRDGQIYISLPE